MNTKAKIVALVTLLAGCELVEPLSEQDQVALDSVMDAWDDKGMPDPGECGPRFEVVRHETLEGYARACTEHLADVYYQQALKTNGCQRSVIRGGWGKTVGILHISPKYHNHMTLIQHEILHWLMQCTGELADHTHSDERVWVDRDKVDSVEATAYKTYE